MADDSSHLPGSGDVKPDGEGPHPPPSPQASSHGSGVPPEPEGSTRSWGPLCLILGLGGCGCLIIVLLAFGIIGGVSWSIFGASEQPEGPANTMGAPPGTELPAPGDGEDMNVAPATPEGQGTAGESDLQRPGAAAAMAWANDRRSDWQVAIEDHSEDWRRVRLLMGPPDSEWTTWIELQWNTPAGRYGLLDEGPLGVDESVPDDVPEIYQPGEDVALEAALGYVEQPDWVARVDSHSTDWRRATVSVGPPASEFVYVVTLQWSDEIDAYDLVSIDDVDYPGME